jgi:hypothetical protein
MMVSGGNNRYEFSFLKRKAVSIINLGVLRICALFSDFAGLLTMRG